MAWRSVVRLRPAILRPRRRLPTTEHSLPWQSATQLEALPAVLPPSITTQPASQTVTAGQTASFSLAATGTAPLSYLWQKNGANIAGATSSSYTTPATTTSDSGSTFRVAVSNSAGTVT